MVLRRGGAARIWACAALLFCVHAFDSRPALAQPNDGGVSFTMGLDGSHAYFFRGIRQETTGIILQPYFDATFTLFDGGEGLNSVGLTVGQWNSVHSSAGTLPNGPGAWYESDFYAGLAFGLENWQAGLTYTSYLSPNHSFGTVQELGLSLSMDDSALLAVPLSPHLGIAIELSGQADGGAAEGVYLELGVEPGLDLAVSDVSVGFPVTLGLSLNNYYEDGAGINDTLGYVDVGAVATMPLAVPESFGAWEFSAGVHLLRLGRYLEMLNDGEPLQIVAAGGLSIAY